MPCFHPIPAWRSQELTKNGKRGVTFSRRNGTPRELEIPCGQCIGCRLEKARQWAMRIEHERKLHGNSAFITLTYDDANVPANGSLRPKDFTDFMKRLRHHHGELRYFQCGEYGETTKRPHHHAVVFGYWPSDGRLLNRLSKDNPLWTSPELERIWGHGQVSYGAVTFESASYVAGYVTKKITGPRAEAHYQGRVPEYATMSRRPGIGRGAFELYHQEIYQDDFVVMNGVPMKPPRYYDRVLEKQDPAKMEAIRFDRVRESKRSKDNKGTRLTAREGCAEARFQLKRREL